MSRRTVIISSRCKLDYKMGYMVVRAEETKRVFIDEIAVLMIENPAVSLTGCRLEALTEKRLRSFSAMQQGLQAQNLFRIAIRTTVPEKSNPR